MNVFFLDTNVFLHFKPVDIIQWENYVPGDFRLAIAPVVLNELDEKKFDSRTKIRDRAKKALKLFDEAIFSEDFSLFIFPQEDAFSEDFAQYGLNSRVQDDRLIISILKYKTNNQTETCYLVTHDTGPRIKAKRFNLNIVVMMEQDQLPPELDDQERENKQLKQEIQRLQNLQPKLKLRFENGEARMSIHLSTYISQTATEPSYPAKLAAIETDLFKNPMMQFPEMVKQRYGLLDINGYNRAIHRYNDNIDEYHQKMRDLSEWNSRSIHFNVVLGNEGNRPAEEVEILFRFPENVTVTKPDERPSLPKLPSAPKISQFNKPTDFIGRIISENSFETSEEVILDYDLYPMAKGDGIFVYKLSELRHSKNMEIGPLWLTFPNVENIKNLNIAYEIHANNLPIPIKSELHLLVQHD